MSNSIKWLVRQYYHLFHPGRMLQCSLSERLGMWVDPIGWGRYKYMGNDWWLLKRRKEWYKI